MDISNIKSVIIRFWKIGQLAADGSEIPLEVFQEYLHSPQYRENLESGACLGGLTHSARDITTTSANPGAKKVVAKDDALIMLDSGRAPIWIMKEMFFDAQSQWMCAKMDFLDETTADPGMRDHIVRAKSLISSGVMFGVSAVVVAYWDSSDNPGFGPSKTGGHDICKKIMNIKSIDATLGPSQKGARIIDVLDSSEDSIREDCRAYSDTSEVGVRCFSAASYEDLKELPKTSKIDLKFTNLKVKEFSLQTSAKISEKSYSVGTVKERLRMAKLSPRQSFRRLMIDYKQAIRAAGGVEKMDPEDVKILKSLFSNDILGIIKQIHPDIMKGKQIATLIGASSISKNSRVACQRLQIPYKMAMIQMQKQGFVSKDRYQKIQDSYIDFTNALIDEVFGQQGFIPEEGETKENL